MGGRGWFWVREMVRNVGGGGEWKERIIGGGEEGEVGGRFCVV